VHVPRLVGVTIVALSLSGTALGATEPPHNAVTAWNDFAARVMTQAEAPNPLGAVNAVSETRIFAMMHAAIHDALNSIEPRYARYANVAEVAGCARAEAAVATAARNILVRLVPDQSAVIENEYSAVLSRIPEGGCTAAGKEAGRAAADAIWLMREHDGSAGTGQVYVPDVGPGQYQFTPPFTFAFLPEWGNQSPWGIVMSDYTLRGPGRLGSLAYALDFNYVKAIGEVNSPYRTDEQSTIAQFWYENSSTGWNRIANQVVREQRLNLWRSARVLALVNFAMADGFIAGFKEKYEKEFWRPITAIHDAVLDGNPLTEPDPEWQPFLLTPPVPDYPSTHTVLGAAAAAVLAQVFGDRTRVTATSTSLPGVSRRYRSFSAAAIENGWSRVYSGIHFVRAVSDGYTLGDRIGRATTRLLPPNR
jgi:membrane-associated phospholipid phosphatase